MIAKLDGRLSWLEVKMKPKELSAAIQGLMRPLAPDDPRLREGVNDEGEAVVSPCWMVSFFEGTREQQARRLRQLRADPRFQKKWNEDEVPVRFEGGARADDVFCHLHEKKLRKIKRGTSTMNLKQNVRGRSLGRGEVIGISTS